MHNKNINKKEVIVAPISGVQQAAVSLIRVSGQGCINFINSIFDGTDLNIVNPNTIHYGFIKSKNSVIDQVLVSVFRSPHSYTKEDTIEISCHGSPYVVKEIVSTIISLGARMAHPGEFTQRAFLNGQMDLSQAEAVADLIASDSKVSHKLALKQLKGNISSIITDFRKELIHFASLLELELDFSEEDLQFANKQKLIDLLKKINVKLDTLINSFAHGNALKEGVPIVIAGKPNVGKSTLLNTLLNENKAIVSDIPGTTRDIIEDTINIDGINFRFIDTAGLRKTSNTVESIGIKKAYSKLNKAFLVLYVVDLSKKINIDNNEDIEKIKNNNIPYIIVGNKYDKVLESQKETLKNKKKLICISASKKYHINKLIEVIYSFANVKGINDNILVTNVRHYDNFIKCKKAITQVLISLNNNLEAELVLVDIRRALQFLGEITGKITTEDLLENIFSKFCIGK